MKRERESFSKRRDKDKDGWLNKEEVTYMIAPPGYDPPLAEAKHLIHEADTNKVSAKSTCRAVQNAKRLRDVSKSCESYSLSGCYVNLPSCACVNVAGNGNQLSQLQVC